jgi:hypothetical protein
MIIIIAMTLATLTDLSYSTIPTKAVLRDDARDLHGIRGTYRQGAHRDREEVEPDQVAD